MLHPADLKFMNEFQFFWKSYVLEGTDNLSDYGRAVRNEMFKVIQPHFSRLIAAVDEYETEKQNVG